MKKIVLSISLLILIAIGGYFYFSSTHRTPSNINTVNNSHSIRDQDQIAPAIDSTAFPATDNRKIKVSRPLELLAKSQNAAQAFSGLWPLAQEGNTEAIVATFELMSRCGQFYGEDRYKPKNTSELNSPTFALREAAIKRSSDYCNDINGFKIFKGQKDLLRDQLLLAEKQGDEFAVANSLISSEIDEASADTARRLMLESKQPWVVEQALLALSMAKDKTAQAIDAKVFASASDTPEHRMKIKQYAAKWKACSMGYSGCGPYNSLQESMCMHEASCYSHLTMQDFFKQRMMSQAEYDQMLAYLNAIKR